VLGNGLALLVTRTRPDSRIYVRVGETLSTGLIYPQPPAYVGFALNSRARRKIHV